MHPAMVTLVRMINTMTIETEMTGITTFLETSYIDKLMSYQNYYVTDMTYECMLVHLHHNLLYNDSQHFQPCLCTKHLLSNCEHQYPGIH